MKPVFNQPSLAVNPHGIHVIYSIKGQKKIPTTLSFRLLCSVVAWAALTSTACSMPGSPQLGMMTPPPVKTISYPDYKKSHNDMFGTVQKFPNQCAAFFHNTASGHLTKDTMDVSYHEPTLNENRTALRDLQKTTIYFRVGEEGSVKMIDIKSTSPVGGGHIILERVPVPLAHNVRVQVCVTASDDKPNESKPVGMQVGTRTS